MQQNPIYVFENGDSLGVELVPISGFIMIRQHGVDNKPIVVTKTGDTSVLPQPPTIDDFINNNNLYDLLDRDTLSELEKINSGLNTGWRLLGKDPVNYKGIGNKAVDFSDSTVPSNIFGASGDMSFATGSNTSASGYTSFATGNNTTASGSGSFAAGSYTTTDVENGAVFGKYNVGSGGYIFEIGSGDAPGNRGNLFEADQMCTVLRAPMTSIADIDIDLNVINTIYHKNLITREYLWWVVDALILDDLADVTDTASAKNDLMYYDPDGAGPGKRQWVTGDVDFGLYP